MSKAEELIESFINEADPPIVKDIKKHIKKFKGTFGTVDGKYATVMFKSQKDAEKFDDYFHDELGAKNDTMVGGGGSEWEWELTL